VARLAASFRTYEVGSGDRVAILALNSDRYYQLLYATAWSGAVVVPVNIRWSANEIAYSLVEAEVRTLVVDDAFQPLTAAVRDLMPDLANTDPLRRPRHTALTC
jgi:acyl-CoA synthetase (AMP-forming)/AMP-acid ligase II